MNNSCDGSNTSDRNINIVDINSTNINIDNIGYEQPGKITIMGPNGPINFGEDDLTPEEKIMLPFFRQFLAEKTKTIKKENK